MEVLSKDSATLFKSGNSWKCSTTRSFSLNCKGKQHICMNKERKEKAGGTCMRDRFYSWITCSPTAFQNTSTAATLAHRNSATPRTGTKSLFMGHCYDIVTIEKTFL